MPMDHILSSKVPKPCVHKVDEASMGSSRKTGSHGYVCKMVGEEFQHVVIFYLWFGHLVFLFTIKYDLEKKLFLIL